MSESGKTPPPPHFMWNCFDNSFALSYYWWCIYYVLLNNSKSDTISYYMSKKKYTIYTIWIKKIYYKNTIYFLFWSGHPVNRIIVSYKKLLSKSWKSFKWTCRLSDNDYRVATLSNWYLIVIEISMQSFKSIGKF